MRIMRLRAGHRDALMAWMLATIALGVVFLGFQITEYGHAYHDGLKLNIRHLWLNILLADWFPWFSCNDWCNYVDSDPLSNSERTL